MLPSFLPFSMDSIKLTDMTAVAEAHGSMAQINASTATPSGQLQHCTKNHMLTETRSSWLKLFLFRKLYEYFQSVCFCKSVVYI